MTNTVTKTIDTGLKSLINEAPLTMKISGTCMSPLINDGDSILVNRQRFYWPGDILVKRTFDGSLVAHRLIGCYPRKNVLHYVTRADNAEKADAAIPGSQIIGRICGGKCGIAASNIPLRHRLKALNQFTLLVIQNLLKRINPATR